MNKFYEIKQILSNQQVVEKYLGQSKKHNSTGNWYISPFRQEKTASFCVSDKGIHDFGDSTHYDIISFTAKYFNTTQYKALEILINDFGLIVGNEYETAETIRIIKQKREEERRIKEAIAKWWYNKFINTCNEKSINDKMIKIFEKSANFEILAILYDIDVKLEIELEKLINADDKEKERMFLERLKNDR